MLSIIIKQYKKLSDLQFCNWKMWKQVLTILVLAAHVQSVPEVVNVLKTNPLPLTPKCSQHLDELFSNFSLNIHSWALKMVDASSKLPSGLLSLNFGEMGDFDQCINIAVSTTNAGELLGKYCLGQITITENENSTNELQGASSLGNLGHTIQQLPMWALCLPDGCSSNDANIIGNIILSSLLPEQGIGVAFSDFLCQTKNDVNLELTGGAIATIVILGVWFFTVIASTFYDVYCTFYGKKTCQMIIRCFSVYTNGQKIFKMTPPTSDQLPCLNGLKFISMMWVVAGHQYSIAMNGSITNTKYMIEWADSLYSMFLINGTLAVDTFFTIGGVLMSYGFMKAKLRNVRFNIFLYYLHRYLRLTAPFAVVVLISATLLNYTGSGPKWPFLTLYFQKNCEDYWWSALLYVQNYVNISNMCVGQTWYLDVDMQLYIISPFVFLALWKYPKSCLLFLSLCSLVSIGMSFHVAWEYELPAILSNLYTSHYYDYQNKYYLLTHTRATPWILGVILGYFLYKIKQKEIQLKLNKFVICILWGICLGTLLACVLGGHSTLRSPQYDKWGNALHIALVRPVWSLALTWIILLCSNNYGGPVNWILSLPIYQVLNRFTYSIYLTHVTLLYVIAYDRKWPDHFSAANMAYQFCGTLWFSTGFAVMLVFMIESPMIIIEKILLGNGTKKQTKEKKIRCRNRQRGF